MSNVLKRRLNAIRRSMVNALLGKEIILEQRATREGCEMQLVDMKRRINYGYWKAEALNARDTKLSR